MHDLNSIFKELDSVRDILAETLEGWAPPQLVVIGAESSGKSSLLQRLVMMPILPTAEGVCTRLPIHVRLRFSQEAKAPRLEVYSRSQKRTVEGPFMVPMHSGALDVQEKMNEVLQSERRLPPSASADRILILHIESPHVPSLDVVDMPGLIATPDDARRRTHALMERQVRDHGASSMYLMVLAANTRPNTSLAMQMVQAQGLEGRTLGVFSRCDELADKALGAVRRLMADPRDAGLGGVPLAPHGWFATMNAPPHADGDSAPARLRRQAQAEADFFRQYMPEELSAGRAGSGALVAGLKGMFLEHVRASWAPETLRLLDRALATARAENARLGLPELGGRTEAERARARALCTAAWRRAIEAGMPAAEAACCCAVLAPLKSALGRAVTAERRRLPVEQAVAESEEEEEAVRNLCARKAAEWGLWWRLRLPSLLKVEDARVRGPAGPFALQRFPRFVAAAVRLGQAAADRAQAEALAAIQAEVGRFYSRECPWTTYETDLAAAPPRVTVRRPPAQLMERVAMAFLHCGLALRRGLAEAAETAAEEREVAAGGWAEACGGERARLAERVAQVEAARAGVLRALGAASAEEVLAGGQVRVHWAGSL